MFLKSVVIYRMHPKLHHSPVLKICVLLIVSCEIFNFGDITLKRHDQFVACILLQNHVNQYKL